MLCTIKTILEQPLFEHARILAGKEAINNIVNRVSVYDCPVKDSIADNNIIEKGDLFISGLNQFLEEPEELIKFINVLIDNRCSGLIILDEFSQLISNEIIHQCDRAGCPIIMVDRNISYASLIDGIHRMAIQNYYHVLNAEKITKLRAGELQIAEKKHILYSLNPKIDNIVCVIAVHGQMLSPMIEGELISEFSRRQKDIYIAHDGLQFFLLSASTIPALEKIVKSFQSCLDRYYSEYHAGISMCHSLEMADVCFQESELAMDMAFLLKDKQVKYDATSLLQILIKIKDSNELMRYHDVLVSRIDEYRTENNTTLFDTLKEYVNCKGSFNETAKKLNQSEATIRYRINRLRQIFGMEDDIIQFHTCISTLIMIDQILKHR